MRRNCRIIVLVLSLCAALWGETLLGQEAKSSADALYAWASSNQTWLAGQVTPNAVVPDSDPTRRQLLISYDIPPVKFPQGYHRSSIYDDALGALVFLITGQSDRAAFTLHALARLVRPDGSLWFGYNTANNWPDESDHDGAIIRSGAVAWTGYVLTFYVNHQPACAGEPRCLREREVFRQTAERLGAYLLSLRVDEPGDPCNGLLRLGYGTVTLAYSSEKKDVIERYRGEPALGISTENNISAWFFLRQLASLTGETRWSEAADRIRNRLLGSVWNDALGQFNAGFDAAGTPDRGRALDCASWGALFLLAAGEPEKAQRAMEAPDRYYAASSAESVGYRPYSDLVIYGDPQVGRFFFPDNPRKRWRELPLVWSEGTLGVALAYMRLGQTERARQVVSGLNPLQKGQKGLRCASMELPHQMAEAPCVAASSWLVLVTEALAGNPLAGEVWR